MLVKNLSLKNELPIFALSLLLGLLTTINVLYPFALLAAFFFCIFALERFDDFVILLVFYLPFQLALNVAAGFDVASGRVLILFVLLVWTFKSLKDGRFAINFSLQTLLVCLFLFFAGLSFLQVFEMDRAIRKMLVFLSVFPLYFVLTSFPPSKELVLKILKALFAGVFFISFFAVLQFMAQFIFGINPLFSFFAKVIAPVFYGNSFAAEVVANPSWLVNVGGITLLRSFAIFSDPHIFSFYLGLIIPLLFSFLLIDKESFAKDKILGHRKIIWLAFFFSLLAELFTFSRGGYVGMVASFLVMIFLFRKDLGKIRKKYFGTVLLSIVLALFFFGQAVLARFVSMFNLREGSNVERFKNWQQGLETFCGNFFQGVGIGNYSFFLDPTTAYRTPIYAHNLYLDLGAELGIFALLAWVLLICVTVYELYIFGRRSKDAITSRIALGLIGSLIWYSAHSFFDTSIYAPNILAIFMVVLSLAVLVIRCVKIEKGRE
ncbi:MAG: O-antigen ligase family protein [Candidatus Pacebacteria bacterium]|nr:O-antigen ligase family protein [Candidatus Paceibacterota bacterium]